MKAWVMAALLTTMLAGPSALAQDGPAPTQGGGKTEKIEASAEIVIAHGSNGGKGIDPKLARYKELKNPPFSSYDSYSLLEESTRQLERGKAATLKLPGGGELRVVLDGVEDKSGKAARYVLKATMKKPGGEESSVQVKAKPGAMFFVAGQKHENGILVLGIKVR